ncbi:hypothetical protein EB796_007640 [Bugula neritina]|uniref:Uncharacterized protein n=1 Tax=Bugula neritina TaxID=10212 RepID=A0A7J7K5Z1_BUGNE|nr:hypothetical protein EB796_007640 [Bugula neritina]
MAGYESDEFISYDFDDSYVYRKPTGDRSTNEVAGPKKVRVTEAIANLKQFSRKKTYIELDNYESEDDNETDLNNNTPSDSDTDGEDSETYSDADDFLYSGSKSSLRYGVDSNPLPPPAEPYPLEELRILKLTGIGGFKDTEDESTSEKTWLF